MKPQQWLVVFLRWVGSVMVLALAAVVMPFEWMNVIHRALGLGDLPTAPVVAYLARSASGLYAGGGIALIALASDPVRYSRLIRLAGIVFAVAGPLMFCVDLSVGMPWFWTAAEGPVVMLIGVAILVLWRRANAAEAA